MATFHLKDRYGALFHLRRKRIRLPALGTSTAVLVDWLLSAGLCVGLAALMPTPLTTVSLAALFSLVGYLWLGLAITQAGPPASSPHLTAWDVALLSFVASFSFQTGAKLGAFST